MSVACARLRPEIIRLPPARMSLRRVWMDFLVAAALATGIGGGGLALLFAGFVTRAGGWGPAAAAGLPSLFVLPVVCVLGIPVMLLPGLLGARWVENRRAARWRRAHPEKVLDSRATALLQEVERTSQADYRRLAGVLHSVGGESSRACIVCDEYTDPPDPADELVEPIVIGPSRLIHVTAATGVFVVMLLAVAAVIVAPRFLHISPTLALLLALGAAVAGFAVYGLLWPRYVRFCPGRIEVLRFWLLGRRSRLTEYPLDGGTVVFVRTARRPGYGAGEKVVWRLAAVRAKGLLKAGFVTEPEEAERIWQALRSTASVPSLEGETL